MHVVVVVVVAVSQHWKHTAMQADCFTAAQAHLHLKCKTILIS